jgi:hypothetical protein
MSVTTAFDYLYAFFQNCFHLRDFLEHSGGASKAELQAFMTGNTAMAVCRDIANGTKHLKISRPSIDPKPAILREYHPPGWPGKKPGTSESYIVFVEDPRTEQVAPYELQELASRCLREWEIFLRSKGLLDSPSLG